MASNARVLHSDRSSMATVTDLLPPHLINAQGRGKVDKLWLHIPSLLLPSTTPTPYSLTRGSAQGSTTSTVKPTNPTLALLSFSLAVLRTLTIAGDHLQLLVSDLIRGFIVDGGTLVAAPATTKTRGRRKVSWVRFGLN